MTRLFDCPLHARQSRRIFDSTDSDLGGLDHETRGSSLEGGGDVVAGRRAGALVSCILLLAACSSGNDAVPRSTTASTASSAAITTASTAAPTTMVSFDPETTLAPTTVPATSTTIASTTTAPPTTVDPAAMAESDVRAAVDLAIADFSACLVALPGCDPVTLAATRADPLLAVNASRVTEWNTKGYAIADRDQFRYVIEAVELSDDNRRATATVCFTDGSKLVDPGAAPGGADLVIDGTFTSGREAWDMRLDVDGVWKAYDAPLIGVSEAVDVCPAT